ncbi:MAG: 6-carboxytetrahydropterin synthase [Flavobacteriales bacterium]|jgi:6-pyruvoyltetrahydropterin/6-carboxytetrahydropterin synthase|nr:6-carboxytetrahydropterin synthase [Flavobacteriales bacterium]MDG2086117.1 6-carboxytetrahydropterin synthase [Flavobacteriales bacterium]|tara:strand:- start:2958 stop:3458 length:501 start_codon:yes stop_codon:yes gene_type:complete
MNEYSSTKIFDGYSTAFRQWRAKHSHCQYIHGYAMKFKVTFIGNLDELNWVCDFGSFKRNGIKEHMSYMFDHTTVVAKDDPNLIVFEELSDKKLIQLRVIDGVGCEKFATYVYNYINSIVYKETKGRVKVQTVECFEGGTNNSAIYKPLRAFKTVNQRILTNNKIN